MKKIIFISLFLLTLFNTSCKTTEYVEVEKVTHDTLYQTKHQIDTLQTWVKEKEYIKGDTVYIEKEKLVYKNKQNADTVYINKYKEVPKIVEVVKKEYYIPNVYRYCAAFTFIFLIYIIYRLKNKLKNKWKN